MKRNFCFFTLALTLGVVLPLTRSAVSGQGSSNGWVVWVKTSPCSGRTDWISVTQNNPGEGGTGYYEAATLIQSPLKCRTGAAGCTFAEATAEAAVVRASPRFSSYCCREYSVWQNSATRALSVVKGKFGTAGFGWQIVKGDLCCEEAEALSGKTGLCGGTVAGHFGTREENTSLNGTNLTYYQRPTPDQCQADCTNNPSCKGFTWIKARTYNASDPAMCYLVSAVTGRASAKGHVSAVKAATGGTSTGGSTDTPENDLTGTWVATYRESLSGQDFRFQMTLNPAAGKWQGSLDYVFVNRPDLSFRAQATVQVIGAGRVRLSYQDPRRGAQQAEGTYTRSQMTFGNAANRITYTRK